MTGRDGMRAVATVVDQLGVFTTVRLALKVPEIGAADLPACWVAPTAIGDSHHRTADHPHSPDRLTTVHFALRLFLGQGGEDLERADWVATVAEDLVRALEGHGLGGAVAPLTHVEKGDLTPGKHGEAATLIGSFTLMDDPE